MLFPSSATKREDYWARCWFSSRHCRAGEPASKEAREGPHRQRQHKQKPDRAGRRHPTARPAFPPRPASAGHPACGARWCPRSPALSASASGPGPPWTPPRCPRVSGWTPGQTRLQKRLTRAASAAGVQPAQELLVKPAGQPGAQLLAGVGQRRAAQRLGVLGRQLVVPAGPREQSATAPGASSSPSLLGQAAALAARPLLCRLPPGLQRTGAACSSSRPAACSHSDRRR
jgi:hypothetical protein